ncbi:MAG: hypothetical protein HY718_04695 [Planctomycetes bacterium]|nr:hypothetical protein [Planctomycetota bacterium]
MQPAGRTIMAALGIGLLAAIATMTSAVDPAEGVVRPLRLVVGLVSVLAAAGVTGAAAGRAWPRGGAWVCWLVAGSMAALVPLAVESCPNVNRADLGLLAAAIAASGLAGRRKNAVIGPTATAAACALSPTALILPIGVAYARWSSPHSSKNAVVGLATGLVGTVIGWWTGGLGPPANAYAVGRDLLVVLPVALIGAAGLEWRSPRVSASTLRPASAGCRQAWGCLAAVGLGLVALGAPLDPRILVLPFWTLMPVGLDRLGMLIRCRHGRQAAVAARLAFACGLIVALLAAPAARRLGDGLLLLVHATSD